MIRDLDTQHGLPQSRDPSHHWQQGLRVHVKHTDATSRKDSMDDAISSLAEGSSLNILLSRLALPGSNRSGPHQQEKVRHLEEHRSIRGELVCPNCPCLTGFTESVIVAATFATKIGDVTRFDIPTAHGL